MSRPSSSLNSIEEFLSHERIAMVGLSRDPKDFTRMLFREFVRRGYDMVPVNPNTVAIEGERCFARVSEIQPKVDAVLIMTPANASEALVHECAAAGVKQVWLFRATGEGAVSEAAVAFCRAQKMNVVVGECPFMFLPHNGFHGIHGLLRKMAGSYPRHQPA